MYLQNFSVEAVMKKEGDHEKETKGRLKEIEGLMKGTEIEKKEALPEWQEQQ